MERNVDLILRDMGVRDDYARLASGHLVRRDEFRGGRGRGTGIWGRGGNRGRGTRGHRAGPAVGEYNPNDERIAQVQERESRQNQEESGHPDDINIGTFMR